MEEIFKADWLSRGGNKWLHFNYLWSISSDFISWSTLHISAYNFKRILKFSYTPNFFLTLTFNWQKKFESPICHISSTVLNFSRGFRFINFDFLRCFFSSLSSSPLHPTVLLLIEMKFRKRFREEIFFFFSFFFTFLKLLLKKDIDTMFVYPIKRFSTEKEGCRIFMPSKVRRTWQGANRHSDSAIFWLMIDESYSMNVQRALLQHDKEMPSHTPQLGFSLVSPPSPPFTSMCFFSTLSSPVWTNSLSFISFLKTAFSLFFLLL